MINSLVFTHFAGTDNIFLHLMFAFLERGIASGCAFNVVA